jgi:hypothetical protein
VEIGFLIPNEKLSGFSERRDYLIRVVSERSRLYVDDSLLPKDSSQQYWIWSPGFYAGEVVAELELEGRHEPLKFYFKVDPAPEKASCEKYLKYIQQIVDYAPSLVVGNEPARHAVSGRSSKLSLWVSYARLRCYADQYLAGLRAVVDRPIVGHAHYREQVPIQCARRVDLTTIQRLRTNPALLSAIANRKYEGSAVLENNSLDIPLSEPTLDIPANSIVADQLHRVIRQVERLINGFSILKNNQSETETDIISRMPRRLEYLGRLRNRLQKISRNYPFSEVQKLHAGVEGLNAVSGIPHYDRTHRLGIKLLKVGLSDLGGNERHYLPPTWQIYETWCFVALAQHLEQRYPEYNWIRNFKATSPEMLLEGTFGDKKIKFFSQLSCPSMERQNRYGYCSISRERIPDIILEISNGSDAVFFCLDSKYSVSRQSLLEAMASAHVYRDAIRYKGKTPALSLLIAPAVLETERLFEREYIDNYNVGCVVLSEDDDLSKIIDFIFERQAIVGF